MPYNATFIPKRPQAKDLVQLGGHKAMCLPFRNFHIALLANKWLHKEKIRLLAEFRAKLLI